MKTVYFDSNVFLKLFFEEQYGKETAERILLLGRQNKAKIAISQWVLNESVATVQKKKNEGRMTDREASKILTGIADMMEGELEHVNLALYPITERVIMDSRTTILDTECENAADALHIHVADKANCLYFLTADKPLAETLKNSHLKHKLVAIHIQTRNDLLLLFTALK